MQLTLKERKLLTHLPSDSAQSFHTRHLHSRSAPSGTGSSGREAPDRWSHGQRGAGGSLLGPGSPPGLAERTWPHTPPRTRHPTQVHRGKPIKPHLATQSAQTRLWGMCPKVLTLTWPRASTDLSPFQYGKKGTWVHIRSVLHVKTLITYGAAAPKCLTHFTRDAPFEKQFQTSDEDQKTAFMWCIRTLSPRPVFAVCLWVIVEFQRWVLVPHCKCLF